MRDLPRQLLPAPGAANAPDRAVPTGTALAAVLAAAILAALSAACAHAPGAAAPAAGTPAARSAASSAAPPAAHPSRLATSRPWSDEIVYFVLVDRFANGDRSNDVKVDPSAKGAFHGGDLKGLTERLDDIASLGVTAIWVNPLVKNIDGYVTGAGFPDWGYHGYWADDFHALDPRFGTEADLRAFVAAAHARGIRVLLDVVYNHPGYDTDYLRNPTTRAWLRSGQGGGCGDDDLTSCLAGLPDWKTEQPEVAEFLLSAQIDWARRSGVDGFRLDTVKHVDHPFWKEHRRRTRAELGDGFFLLGEVWGGDVQVLDPWFEPDEMDAGFDFGFQGSAVGFLLGRGRTIAYDRYLQSRHKVRPGHHLSHYLSSHDVTGALQLLGGDKELFRLAAVLQLTTSGIPVIYYGEEVGRRSGEWPENRSDMPWGDRDVLPGKGIPRDEVLREDYRKLIAIRRAHPALSRGTHAPLATEGDLYVFLRRDAATGDAIVVAVNRGKEPATATLATPPGWERDDPLQLFGEGRLARSGDTLTLSVEPRRAVILGFEGPAR
jgi:glycosidase